MSNQFPEIYLQYLGVIIVSILLMGFIITMLQLYQKKKLLQEKEMQTIKSKYEKELLETRLEIQEEVLKNVSMEIHDNIGQLMLQANINMSIFQQMQLPIEAPPLIRDTKLILSKASEDISQLSRSLNSDRITELGVFRSIHVELGVMEQKKLFAVEIEDQPGNSGKDLPVETQLLVFRMFQEITNNIIKHAQAAKVTVVVEKREGGIDLIIADNGVGFNFGGRKEILSDLNGMGLRSLFERARLFKGEIDLQSSIDKGTRISIWIPGA